MGCLLRKTGVFAYLVIKSRGNEYGCWAVGTRTAALQPVGTGQGGRGCTGLRARVLGSG